MRFLGRRLAGYGRTVKRAVVKIPRLGTILCAGAGIITFLLVLPIPSLFYSFYVQTIELSFYHKNMERIRAYSSPSPSNGCSIPQYDPFDDEIRKFIYPYAPIDCGWNQPYLTYVDDDGYIHINESGLQEAGLGKEDIECTYASVRRRQFSDDEVNFTTPRVFRDGEKLDVPFVKVNCLRRSTGTLVYETVHALVQPLSLEQSERVKPASALRPSVLIIGIDSMSRLNFIRQLPRTHALITETFGATVFTGLVKVGDNTYPNTLTMLTGMAAYSDPNIHVTSWGRDKANGFFDDLPVVWKNFSENGCVTMLAQDRPSDCTFNNFGKGFAKQPTDYYMRPFWLAFWHSIKNFKSSDYRCYGNIPIYEFLFNYIRNFVNKMREKRYFAFTFLADFSHDGINEVQVLERPLYNLLAELHRSGALNNTVLVVMGDHGNRFDSIRATVVGRVEEQLPYFAVALPPDLRTARPYLEEGLRGNRDTFISWYDVYEMLADIAFDNLQPVSRVTRWAEIGYSLFRPVPARTCYQAGVPWEYCVCLHDRVLSTQEPSVWRAARTLVAHVNTLLPVWADRVCAPLALAEVISAQLLVPPLQLASPQDFSVDQRIVVRVTPSQALLEGLVCHNAWNFEGFVKGQVARINKYGNQSHCIRDKILRLYCYCTDLLPRTPAPSA